MKSIFRILTTIIKYGSLVAVVLNIAKVAMDEIEEKFPELLEDEGEEEEELKASPAPEAAAAPEKKKRSILGIPF